MSCAKLAGTRPVVLDWPKHSTTRTGWAEAWPNLGRSPHPSSPPTRLRIQLAVSPLPTPLPLRRGQLPQPLFHLPPRCHFVAVAIAATGDVVGENSRPGPAGEDGKKETDLDTSLAAWEPLR